MFRLQSFTDLFVFRRSKRQYAKHREVARAFVMHKVLHWNALYGYKFGRVTIKDQKRRWGSCSSKGNLNFNYRIVHLPQHLADYIVVHELCHLKEFNHSKAFWDLVGEAIPDYAARRAELKKFVVGRQL